MEARELKTHTGQMAEWGSHASRVLSADPFGMLRGKDAETRPEFWPQPMGKEDWSLTEEEEVRAFFYCLTLNNSRER